MFLSNCVYFRFLSFPLGLPIHHFFSLSSANLSSVFFFSSFCYRSALLFINRYTKKYKKNCWRCALGCSWGSALFSVWWGLSQGAKLCGCFTQASDWRNLPQKKTQIKERALTQWREMRVVLNSTSQKFA